MNKLLRFLSIFLLSAVFSSVSAETYEFQFTKEQVFKNTGETKDLGGKNWTLTTNATFMYFSTYSNAFSLRNSGSGGTQVKLSTADFSGTITKVIVFAGGSSSAKASVKVGGSALGTEQTLSYNSADYTFEGSASGELELNFTNPTTALNISKITVEYEASGKTPAGLKFETSSINAKLKLPFTEPTLTNPNNLPVTYSSTNTAVAEVDANTGKVTLKAEGTTTIQARSEETETLAAGRASYTLNVIGKERTTVWPSPFVSSLEMTVGEKKTVIGVVNNNDYEKVEGVEEFITYSSSKPEVVSVDEHTGEVTALQEGEATITINFAGNDDYKPSSRTYNVRVRPLETLELTVTEAGYATISSEKVLDFTSLPELKLYTITATNDNKATTKEFSYKILRANNGLLVQAVPGTYQIPISASEVGYAPVGNLLRAVANTDVTADGTQYVLSNVDGVVGFRQVVTGDKIKKNTAYLRVAGGAAKTFVLDGEATGINLPNVETPSADGIMYNLSGQRVSKNYKGIVIINGKKVIRK
nr:Ig-like domain-containing protein [uncultured Prevotella sp.]